jgi:DNA polymerase III subunit epsilon
VNGGRRIQGPGPHLPCGLVVIDFEAVTPAGRTPEPVEVAALALRWIGGQWYESARFAALIRPPEGTPIPEMNTRITGITEEMLEGARPAAQVLGDLDRRLTQPDYRLVAHGAGTEALLLRAQRAHCPTLAATPLIDTVAMARAVLGRRGSYRLDAVLERYEVPVPPDRHRAEADVALTAQIFLRLLTDGQQTGLWSDLAGLERAAGRAPAHRPEAGEQTEIEVPAS